MKSLKLFGGPLRHLRLLGRVLCRGLDGGPFRSRLVRGFPLSCCTLCCCPQCSRLVRGFALCGFPLCFCLFRCSPFGCRPFCRCLLFSLLRGQFRGLFRGQFRGLLSGQLRGFIGGLFRCQAGGVLSSALSDQIRLACLHFSPCRLSQAAIFGIAFRVSVLNCPGLLFIDGLLHAQASLFPGLRPRSREITIFCAMEIGPGIERRHVFWGLILVGQRFMIGHSSPQSLPLSLPEFRAFFMCKWAYKLRKIKAEAPKTEDNLNGNRSPWPPA